MSGLAGGGRRQLIMACGTGKTFVASRAAARLAGDGVTAVLVPSIPLAAQTIAAWQAGCPTDQVLAVCSDPTVRPTWVRAADLPAQVTTDVEEIAKWLADASGRALAVAVFDSAHRLAAGLRRAGQVAGLTVCDEAHRLAGAPDKFTAAITEPGFLPERRRLSMTATPRISSDAGRREAPGRLDGRREAVRAGRLPLPVPPRDRRRLAQGLPHRGRRRHQPPGRGAARRQGRPRRGRDVPVRLAAAQAALAMAAAQFGLRRCVAFLPRIALARQFAGRLPATLAMLPEPPPPGRAAVGRVRARRHDCPAAGHRAGAAAPPAGRRLGRGRQRPLPGRGRGHAGDRLGPVRGPQGVRHRHRPGRGPGAAARRRHGHRHRHRARPGARRRRGRRAGRRAGTSTC